MKILVSAGEASGDRYAAGVVAALRPLIGDADFFGSTGVEMRAAGVRTVVDSASLAVVGLVEVLHHIPRIYGEYRRLLRAADQERPALAILADSPDFHLRVAAQLARRSIPVVYLVAPQAWAWRAGRARQLARNVKQLHCIFPFEEDFFRARGVDAHYIGHPLARRVRPSMSRDDFFRAHNLPEDQPLITLCPGSRKGEIARHLPALSEAVERLSAGRRATFLLAAPPLAGRHFGAGFYAPLTGSGRVRYIEGSTWDALAHADLAMVASGTVTTEAALLGTPMLTFYRVTRATWLIGRPLVKVPFYSMVNLVAQRPVVKELIQDQMTGEALAAEAGRLLNDGDARAALRRELAQVRDSLLTATDPFEESARRIAALLNG